MLIISLICLLAATVIFALVSCFVKKNSPAFFLLKAASIMSLAFFAMLCANYKNSFDGYSILLILSVFPAFVTLVDLKSYIDQKKEEKTAEEIFAEENDLPKKQKKQSRLLQSNGQILFGVAALLSAVCISIASLYKGVESVYSFGLGISIGFSLTFLSIIIKKNLPAFDLLNFLLIFVSAGLLLAQILMVVLYSTALANLIFCAGAAVICLYNLLKIKFNGKFLDLIYFLGMICLIASIIV